MSTNDVIVITNLSKSFDLNVITGQSNNTNKFEIFNNINLSVQKGDCVGITGPNGCGKSTLLKILAGIMRPDNGLIEIRGKVASILDIGAGFHPELTAEENVFLVGQIHGFKRAYIKSKIDEIFTFAEVTHFRKQPLKFFSNGMFLRLAFSTITSFDFDIFLLDEVLSVGDFYFQAKCKKRIQELIKESKTFLIVSHQLIDLNICSRILNLNDLKSSSKGENLNENNFKNLPLFTNGKIEIVQFFEEESVKKSIKLKRVIFYQNENSQEFERDFNFYCEFCYIKFSTDFIYPVLIFTNQQKQRVLLSSPFLNGDFNEKELSREGLITLKCEIDKEIFSSEIYTMDILFMNKNTEYYPTNEIEDNYSNVSKHYKNIFQFKVIATNLLFNELTEATNLGGLLLKFNWENINLQS